MRKLLLAVVLVTGFAICAYAEDASKVAKQVTTELQNSRVITAKEASSVSASVKSLIESGVTASEAKSVVAQAARQAKAQGLKGKDLAARVQEAAKARKAEMEEAKKKAKETEEKAKKKTKETGTKANKEAKDSQKRLNRVR